MTSRSLPATLRHLREVAGMSQTAVARHLAAKDVGLNQSKISRAENGATRLDMQQLAVLCDLYSAPADVRRDLEDMVRALEESTTPARMVLHVGSASMQNRIHKLESAAQMIRNFSTTAIHGLLQVRGYIEALFGDSLPPADRDRVVQARLAGQGKLVSERQFTFVMPEGALYWCMGGPAVMVDQLDHLVVQSRLPNVRVGIIRWDTPATVPGLHPFTLYDGLGALIGAPHATAVTSDADNIAALTAHWDELQPLVSWGDDARSAIVQAADRYRSKIV